MIRSVSVFVSLSVYRSLFSLSLTKGHTHARHHAFHLVHLPHHLAHLVELLHKSIYLSYLLARAFGNTLAAAAIYLVRITTLIWGHGVDDSFYAFESIVGYIYIFYSLAYTRY